MSRDATYDMEHAVDGPVTADGERTRTIREQVRIVLDSMSGALDLLDDAGCFFEGFTSAMRLMDRDCQAVATDGIYPLRSAQAGIEQAVSDLEDIANGGDDD